MQTKFRDWAIWEWIFGCPGAKASASQPVVQQPVQYYPGYLPGELYSQMAALRAQQQQMHTLVDTSNGHILTGF